MAETHKKRSWRLKARGIAATAIVLGSLGTTAQGKELVEVPFALSWFGFQTHHMPYWLALDKGWYEDQGIKLVIKQNRGSAASIKSLVSGQILFAEVAAPTLLQTLAKQEGVNVKMIGIFDQRLTHGLGFLKKTGIKTPKDFEGKTLGIVAQSMNNMLWPAFAGATGIDDSKVRKVYVDWTNFRQLMLSGKTDITNWVLGQAEDRAEAAKGRPVAGFTFGEFLPLLGSGMATTTDLIENRPELVQSFMRATQKALKYMIESPRRAVVEAAKIQTKHLDKIPKEELRIEASLEVVPWAMVTEKSKDKPAGWSDPDDWQAMIDLLSKFDKWPRTPTVAEAMTNEFVAQ